LNTDFGIAETVDLMPSGSNVAVTKENRLEYVYLISLGKQTKMQSEAFFEGLSEIIDPTWLKCVSLLIRLCVPLMSSSQDVKLPGLGAQIVIVSTYSPAHLLTPPK
jgi:hypothetical protein